MSHSCFCYVHLGAHPPPDHLLDSLYQTQTWNPRSRIDVALSERHVKSVEQMLRDTKIDAALVDLVPIETLRPTAHHVAFQASHHLDEHFRNGFWRYTSERFFVLEEVIEQFRLEDVIHLENDVMMYFSADEHLSAFRRAGQLALTRDAPSRVVPGLVYCRSYTAVRTLNLALCETARRGLNDMDGLAVFLRQHPQEAGALPIIMPDYLPTLAPEYSQGFDRFRSIFDAAAIGQYLGGIDPRNADLRPSESASVTAGFVNETAVFSCADLEFAWEVVHELRRPVCRPRGGDDGDRRWTRINNLHIHAKELQKFSSHLWLTADDIVTGERLQGLAEISIIPRDMYAFHQHVDDFAREAVLIDDYSAVDQQSAINFLSSKRSFFVYTHALADFSRHIWPRLQGRGYVLITHNSDHEIDEKFLPLLADDKLARWFAQNATISHPKLVPLPIGIANSMWPHGNLEVLYEAIAGNRKRRKDHLVYLHFNQHTHPERRRIWETLRRSFPEMPEQPEKPRPFGDYLADLARHRFAVCPQGNGSDTHRIWESLYLDVIPVIERSPHVEYWSRRGLPLLIVDDWEELTPDHLLESVARASHFDAVQSWRAPLRLSYYRELVLGAAE